MQDSFYTFKIWPMIPAWMLKIAWKLQWSNLWLQKYHCSTRFPCKDWTQALSTSCLELMYQTCLGSLKSTCQEVVLKVLLLRHNCIKALLVFNDKGRIPGNFTRQASQWDFPFLYPTWDLYGYWNFNWGTLFLQIWSLHVVVCSNTFLLYERMLLYFVDLINDGNETEKRLSSCHLIALSRLNHWV